jgi:hypothetical protein
LDQNGKWVVRRDCRTSDTGSTAAGRQSGPKVFAVRYAERGNPIPSPSLGRLTVRHAVGGMGRDDGKSQGHPVMGWIRVENLRLDITRRARELTFIGCFFARKRAEPILGGKANEATLCVPCALHQMGFGCQRVSQR